jgi:menaquinone-dependent protoporphyrinogen oxidase
MAKRRSVGSNDRVESPRPHRFLIAYATKHGSTQEVAAAIAAALRGAGAAVDLQPARTVRDLASFDAVVLGAPLYTGRWHRDAHGFLKRHRKSLEQVPVAVFALGPRQPVSEGTWPRSQEQLDDALADNAWLSPVGIALFGGADPPKQKRERRDQRDWAAIRVWALELATAADLWAEADTGD